MRVSRMRLQVASVNSGNLRRPQPKGEGGPEKMSGAVVANLDAIPTASAPAVYTSPQGDTGDGGGVLPG